MGTVLSLSLYDERIDEECAKALPNHPHVAQFMAKELRARAGSVYLARELAARLASLNERQQAAQEHVQQLSLVGNREALTPIRRRISRTCSGYIRSITRLTAFLHETSDKQLIRQSQIDEYISIYTCAYAMLSGKTAELVAA